MDDSLKKKDNETPDQYFYRVCSIKEQLGFTWEQMKDIFNHELGCNKDESKYRKDWNAFQRIFEANVDQLSNTDDIRLLVRQLEKERKKLQTEKIEYNKWLREDARDELIAEKIQDAIRSLPPLKIPNIIKNTCDNKERIGCLLIADAHYGVEFEIKGLFGEVLNLYNPEIFERRMWDLLNQTLEICEKEQLTQINVYEFGDEIAGLLRVSQLWTLKYGVIESAIYYSRFIVEWLNVLSHYVKIRYQMVKDSNHCQLRLLGQPKNTFKEENVSYIIKEKIMDKLDNNPNFEYIQNPTGYIFDQQLGYNILGIHGECRDFAQAIKDFSKTYNVSIDFLFAGHKHHQNSKNVGIESDVVGLPSIMGIDDYAMSLNRTADPGATFVILEKNKGKTIEYNIKL